MIAVLYILIALQALSAIGAIALIGDERKPRTKNEAIATVVVSSFYIILYCMIIHALRVN